MFNPRTLMTSFDYREVNNEPSMVEPCYNPSIAEIVENPNCLVRHGMYDEGDDLPDDMDDNFSYEPLYATEIVSANSSPKNHDDNQNDDVIKGEERAETFSED